MKQISAAEVAKNFINGWVFKFGPPEELIAENSGCITMKYFKDVCWIMNVAKNFITVYQPQKNGHAERHIRTILAALRTYAADQHRYSYLHTDVLTFAYNCQPHKPTLRELLDLFISKPPLLLAEIPRRGWQNHKATSNVSGSTSSMVAFVKWRNAFNRHGHVRKRSSANAYGL